MAFRPTLSSASKAREKTQPARFGIGTPSKSRRNVEQAPPAQTSNSSSSGQKNPLKNKNKPSTKIQTFRASAIPKDFDELSLQNALAQALKSQWGNDLHVRSWAADYINSDGLVYRTATFECGSLSAYLKLPHDNSQGSDIQPNGKGRWKLELNHTVSEDVALISIDTVFDGFTPLSPLVNRSKHTVDCIAIHGWGSHAFGGFKATNDDTFMWLRDSLSRDMPQLRVWTYGYEFDLKAEDSIAGVDEYAESFRNHLRDFRKHAIISSQHMPIIFIAHSLGGIILKQSFVAMKISSVYDDLPILESVVGILFFGVPTQGMNTSALGAMVGDKPQRYDLMRLNQEVGQYLRAQQHKAFCAAFDYEDSKIFQFFETQKTPTVIQDTETKTWSRSGPLELLVNPTSATYGRSWEDDQDYRIPLPGNHSSMIKFDQFDRNGYPKVRSILEVIVGDAVIIKKRHALSEDGQDFLASLAFPEMAVRAKNIDQPLENTFQWILENSSHGFPEWLATSEPFFWVSGKPGSGKSTLMKHILQLRQSSAVQNREVVIGHFFNDRGSLMEHNAEGFLRSIIYQILSHSTPGSKAILDKFCQAKATAEQTGSHSQIWKIETLQSMFDDLTRLFGELNDDGKSKNRIFFVIDALDECDDTFKHFKEVIYNTLHNNASQRGQIKFCCASRSDPRMLNFAKPYPSLNLQSRNAGDIRTYVETTMKTTAMFIEEIDGQILSSLCNKIISRADGIILWVKLVVQELLDRHENGETISELQDALETIPLGIAELFQRILNKIPNSKKLEARTILWILLGAERQLTLKEIRQAVAVVICSQDCQSLASLDIQRNDQAYKRRLYSQCGALIEVSLVDDKIEVVRFIHQTAKEFVQEQADFFFPIERGILPLSSHYILLMACAKFRALSNPQSHADNAQPFNQYARLFWIHHWTEVDKSPRECNLIMSETDFSISQLLDDSTIWLGTTPLEVAISRNVVNFVEASLKGGADPNSASSEHGSLLQIAALNGHCDVIKILLNHGADINLQSYCYGNALNAAAVLGNKETIDLLLDRNASFLDNPNDGNSALRTAIETQNSTAIEVLLQRGAISSEIQPESLLEIAAIEDDWDTVELLLDYGVDINIISDSYGKRHTRSGHCSLLHIAEDQGKDWIIIAKLLIRGVNYEAKDNNGNTAFYGPCRTTADKITKLLLCSPMLRGALTNRELCNMSVREWNYWFNWFEFFYAVLQHGFRPLPMNGSIVARANSNTMGDHQWTLLHVAASIGSYRIARKLLQNGADIDATTSTCYTPLHLAILQFADLKIFNNMGSFDIRIIWLLVKSEADLRKVTPDKWTPLHLAVYTNSPKITHLILTSNPGMINTRNQGRWTPLHLAVCLKNFNITHMLLKEKADLSLTTNKSWISLHFAAKANNRDLVALLLFSDPNINGEQSSINKRTMDGHTALHFAVEKGNLEVVRLLLDNGADIEIKDNQGLTAVDFAKERENTEILRLFGIGVSGG